jgi:hypothetical protein
VQRHGIDRHLQRPSSGSTPHDRAAIPQICPSRSLALDRPRQSAPRYPSAVANRRAICRARCYLPRIRPRLHRRTTRCTGSISINELTRGAQIPIAPAAPPYVPLSAVSSLGGFRTPAAVLRGTTFIGRHPKPFTDSEVGRHNRDFHREPKPSCREGAPTADVAGSFDHFVGVSE